MSDTITLPPAPDAEAAVLAAGGAVAWREPLEIGTYEPGEPDRYPMFLDQRVYQGSSGRVYPLPFIDSVSSTKTTRSWDAIHIENEWIDRKSTRLNSSHRLLSRMPSSA